MNNKMFLKFCALSENEGFARSAVAAFIMNCDPTIDTLTDIKTAVSEAVTNCVVHGYPNNHDGQIIMQCEIIDEVLHIKIRDYGVGIRNLEEVLQPFYTSKPLEERSGMGFTIMRTFMDSFDVESEPDMGTTVTMTKNLTTPQ